MAMILENGKMTEIGSKFGLTRQGVSQIIAGKRPQSIYARLVKGAAYEAGGLISMDVTHTDAEMVCSWADGQVQLILSKKTGTVYKVVNGQQVDSWKGMQISDFIKKQKECEKLAAINF